MRVTSQLYVIRGDLCDLSADAVVMSTSVSFAADGKMYPEFVRRFPGLARHYAQLKRERAGTAVGASFWIDTDRDSRPHGVIITASIGRGLDRDASRGWRSCWSGWGGSRAGRGCASGSSW
jgi:hypothetical protein